MPYFPRSLGIPYISDKSFCLEIDQKIAELASREKMPRIFPDPQQIRRSRTDMAKLLKNENA